MFSMTFQGTTLSGTLQASLNVTENSGPAVAVNPGALNFSLTQGSTSVVTQSIVIANSGNSTENFMVTATPNSGGNWLSVSPRAGTVAPYHQHLCFGEREPERIGAWAPYSGTISIAVSPANQQFSVAVLATVSSGQAQLQLSQSGLRFQTSPGAASRNRNRSRCSLAARDP